MKSCSSSKVSTSTSPPLTSATDVSVISNVVSTDSPPALTGILLLYFKLCSKYLNFYTNLVCYKNELTAKLMFLCDIILSNPFHKLDFVFQLDFSNYNDVFKDGVFLVQSENVGRRTLLSNFCLSSNSYNFHSYNCISLITTKLKFLKLQMIE